MLVEDKTTSYSFNPTSLDIFLAVVATVVLPFSAYFLFHSFGAFIPLFIYYVIFCYGIVYWRRKSLNYTFKFSFNYSYFIAFLFFEFLVILISINTYKFTDSFDLIGFLITLLIWAPINGLSEQLLWIYIYESFEQYILKRYSKTIAIVVGLIFYFSFIGLIHIFFWAEFLFKSETLKVSPWTQLLILSQFIVAIGYLVTYKQSKSMWPVFILHVITDIGAVLLTGYSIIPDLFLFMIK